MPQWTGFISKDKEQSRPAPFHLKKLSSENKSSSSLPPTGGRSSPAPSLRSLSRLTLSNRSSPLPHGTKENAEDAEMFNDILQVRRALDCFLDSRIKEAEDILAPHRKVSMYYSLGYSFILFLKCAMTFEQKDVEETMDALKHTIQLANALRHRGGGWLDNITTWVKGNQIQHLKAMSRIQRHAVSV